MAPSAPTIESILSKHTDSKEAWEALIAHGIVPARWYHDDRRVFLGLENLCERCHGDTEVSDDMHHFGGCASCRAIGATMKRSNVPVSIEQCASIAADPSRILQAEELATEALTKLHSVSEASAVTMYFERNPPRIVGWTEWINQGFALEWTHNRTPAFHLNTRIAYMLYQASSTAWSTREQAEDWDEMVERNLGPHKTGSGCVDKSIDDANLHEHNPFPALLALEAIAVKIVFWRDDECWLYLDPRS